MTTPECQQALKEHGVWNDPLVDFENLDLSIAVGDVRLTLQGFRESSVNGIHQDLIAKFAQRLVALRDAIANLTLSTKISNMLMKEIVRLHNDVVGNTMSESDINLF